MNTRHLLLVALAGLGALTGRGLQWNTDTLTVATTPFQQTQDVVFEFTNTSAKPVALVDLQTNCDCLDVSADQPTYAPGARGVLKARFTIGDRAGLYERLITVVTDESPKPVRLVVRIEVPETATASPRSVQWTVNEPPAAKTVELAPAPGLEINFAEAQATNDAFAARLETLEPGRRYRLHLTPRTTAAPASAAIRVLGREKSGRDVVVSAYASVQ
jgi:hypothetical protein